MKYLKWITTALISIAFVALLAALINYGYQGSFSIPDPVWAGVICGGLVAAGYLTPRLTKRRG